MTEKTGASKNKKAIELQTIYDAYKNSKAADIKKTLLKIEEDEKATKERVDERMKIEKNKAKKQQREEAVRAEIDDIFKRYMDKKIIDEVQKLEQKRVDIDRIRQYRERSRSRSPNKYETATTRRKPPNKSPIHLEGSLDIDESKAATEVVEESLGIKNMAKKIQKTTNKQKIAELEQKYTLEEISFFEYEKERTKVTETLKLLGKVYAYAVFKSREHRHKFTNEPRQLLEIYKELRNSNAKSDKNVRSPMYEKQLADILKNHYQDETRNYLIEARDYIEKQILEYFTSEVEFKERFVYNYEKDTAPRLRSNDNRIVYYETMNEEKKKRRGIYRQDGQVLLRKFVAEENEKLKQEELKQKRKEEKKLLSMKKLTEKIAQDFKNPEVKAKPLDELALPKDKWKRGKKLLELKNKFPHDLVLQRMIKDEFKENRVFKYPEEYEIYDDEEEEKRKLPKYKVLDSYQRNEKEKDIEEKQKVMIEKFLFREDQREQQQKIIDRQKKEDTKRFNEAMKREVENYIEEAKQRLNKKREKGQRETLAEIYRRLRAAHQEIVDERYPHPMYGLKKGSRAEQLSFPQQFKIDFYELFRKIKKRGRANSTRPAYFVPGGVSHTSYNAKIKLGEENEKKREKQPPGVKTRVWKRDDYLEAKREIMMLQDDADNCTFEPNAGSQNLHMKKILNTYPEFQREEYDKEKGLKDFVDRLGDKFCHSNPEIFKGGILRAAQGHFNAGKFKDALSKLSEGFKFDSLKSEFEKGYLFRQMFKKKKFLDVKKEVDEQEKKEEENAKMEETKEGKAEEGKKEDKKPEDKKDEKLKVDKLEDTSKDKRPTSSPKKASPFGGLIKKDESKEPDKMKEARKRLNEVKPYEERFPHQKEMRGEQFEKPKLKPILEEAYNLLIAIEKAMEEEKKKEKQLRMLVQNKNKQLEEENKKKEEEFKKKKQEKLKKEIEDKKKRDEENEKIERKQRRIEAKLKKQEEDRKREMAKKLKEEKKNIAKLSKSPNRKSGKLNKDLK